MTNDAITNEARKIETMLYDIAKDMGQKTQLAEIFRDIGNGTTKSPQVGLLATALMLATNIAKGWDVGDYAIHVIAEASFHAGYLYRYTHNDDSIPALSEIIARIGVVGVIDLENRLTKYQGGLTPEGRAKGSTSTKERAEAHKAKLRKAVEDILQNRQTFDMGDGEIATFLMHPTRAFHKFEGIEKSRKTMMRYVKEIRAEFKSRK